MTRTARLAGLASIARPWPNEPGLITRYFDCGVAGIMVPHVENGATARRMVDVVRCARQHMDILERAASRGDGERRATLC